MNAEEVCYRQPSAGIDANTKNTVYKWILVLQKDEKSNIMRDDGHTKKWVYLTHKKTNKLY